jgi:type IV secretion system protein VirB10
MPFSSPLQPARQAPRVVSGQALITDASTQGAQPNTDADQPEGQQKDGKRGALSTTRARAAMLANRSTTVPQGTLIPAVLETAFDSTSPGFARALVQRDIYGFDGSQVLIPRGSRLVGEYGADTARGQQRAVILWARLIRPDGVTIAIASPAADTLGRGGVKADVNSHFFERFSGAILQSVLDVGVNLAARNSRSPVIVALPSTSNAVTSVAAARTTDVTPTLRVPAGRSVSVFVARDLDFTGAGAVR